MTRVPLLILALLLPGCGEADRPRFTPAPAVEKPGEAVGPAKASREVAIPRNIETH